MKEMWMRRARGISCALLLALLALCGWMGARGVPQQTVSVATTRATLPAETADSSQDAAARLVQQRQEEIAMLQAVIDNAQTDTKTRQSALTQMTQIAERMELEARSVACLEQMGFSNVSAVCGAGIMTIMMPYAAMGEEGDQARVIDAVCTQTGMEPADVKIILTKK